MQISLGEEHGINNIQGEEEKMSTLLQIWLWVGPSRSSKITGGNRKTADVLIEMPIRMTEMPKTTKILLSRAAQRPHLLPSIHTPIHQDTETSFDHPLAAPFDTQVKEL